MQQTKNSSLKKAPADIVFSLDIGTHSIVGIVGTYKNGILKVLACEEQAHTSRAMIDGQIEDVDEVSRLAQQVKEKLENQLCIKLEKVCVAAAGRTLVTQKGEWQQAVPAGEAVNEAFIDRLESAAMQQAYELMLDKTQDLNTDFCCVGYSPLSYTLDGYKISQLKGHKGAKAAVEIIATFLPQGVVDSLYDAMKLIDLTVESLTLEPIAAMNAIIPKEIRLLNLALVDIGAGTSDIAVSTGGTVSAYTMATIAGDELTEALVHQFLVDFNTAEKIKHGPSEGQEAITYLDILGIEHTVTGADIEKAFSAALDNLTKIICDRILDINGKAPAAVFLVGGGSQVVGLCQRVAQSLGLEESRVAVGSNNYMKKMVQSELDIFGPQFATPVGIGLTAAKLRSKASVSILVNGEKVVLPNEKNFQVIEALGFCGYGHNKIMERSGQNVSFTLNGEKVTVRGTPPTPAIITINGEPAVLSTIVEADDEIVITPAVAGQDAKTRVVDIIGEDKTFNVYADGKRITIGTMATINGRPASLETKVCEDDIVETEEIDTLGAVCMMVGVNPAQLMLFVNDDVANPSSRLKADDKISWCAPPPPQPVVHHAPPLPTQPQSTAFVENNSEITVTLNDRQLTLPPKADGTPYLFLDLLNFVDIDLTNPQGVIMLILNGKNAAYMARIRHNDVIQIYWDKP